MECKNCNTIYEGSFCPNCGQSSGETRLNIKFFIDQFNKKYNPLKSHKSIFSFIKSPITYIDNYINCKRVNVVDPITLLFVSVGLFLLISGFINPYLPQETVEDNLGMGNLNKIIDWSSKNMGLMNAIVIIPFSGLTWLLFKKSKFNFAEHIAVNMYLSSISIVFSLIDLCSELIKHKTGINLYIGFVLSLLSFTYPAFVFCKVIDGNFNFKSILKYIIAESIFFVFLIIIILITVFSL